jgi:hypothetical protein
VIEFSFPSVIDQRYNLIGSQEHKFDFPALTSIASEVLHQQHRIAQFKKYIVIKMNFTFTRYKKPYCITKQWPINYLPPKSCNLMKELIETKINFSSPTR